MYKTLELPSLLLSAVGAVAAIITHQVAVAVLPFSLSLGLGWLDRQAQLQQSLALKESIQRLTPTMETLEAQLQSLRQSFNRRSEPEQISALQQSLMKLEQSATEIHQLLPAIQTNTERLEVLESQLPTIQTATGRLDHLEPLVGTLEAQQGQLLVRLSDLCATLSQWQAQLTAFKEEFEQRSEPQQIASLQQGLANLADSLTNLQQFIPRLEEYTQRIGTLETLISDIRAHQNLVDAQLAEIWPAPQGEQPVLEFLAPSREEEPSEESLQPPRQSIQERGKPKDEQARREEEGVETLESFFDELLF